ncbi:MAG: septal ring lytic transglycosylase RlpA family protein [Burkholderiaceae bacterium]
MSRSTQLFLAGGVLLASLLPAAQAADNKTAVVASAFGEKGMAAVAAERALGSKTASGERYDPSKLTAAHRSLPFGTEVMVRNPKTHKSVVVRVNDRALKSTGSILEVSPAAARALGMRGAHEAEVSVEVVAPPPKTHKG